MTPRLANVVLPPPEREIRFHSDDLLVARARALLCGLFVGLVAGALATCLLLESLGRLR